MSALPWIAAGLAAGGLYLWYRSRQAAPTQDLCAKLCAASGPYCIDGGASCRAIGSVVDSVSTGLFDSSGPFWAERDRREALNGTLNGAPDISNSPAGVGDPMTVSAKTLRYKNKCVPLEYSPGWSSCKAGTLDMYGSAIDAASGKREDETEGRLLALGAYTTHSEFVQAQLDRHDGAVGNNGVRVTVVKDNAMTGAVGDPTTVGPYGTDDAPWWYVRGQQVFGTKGFAPRAVVLQQFDSPSTPRTAQIIALSDVDALAMVPIGVDPAIIHTTIAITCGVPSPGFSWVPDTATVPGHMERTQAGKSDVAQPCPPPPISASQAASWHLKV